LTFQEKNNAKFRICFPWQIIVLADKSLFFHENMKIIQNAASVKIEYHLLKLFNATLVTSTDEVMNKKSYFCYSTQNKHHINKSNCLKSKDSSLTTRPT